MALETDIIHLMEDRRYLPLKTREVARQLNLKADQYPHLRRTINTLQKSGRVVSVKGNRYCLARDTDLISGIILFRQSGVAFLIPDSLPGEKEKPRLRIRAEDTGVALHGDHVLARKKRPEKKSFRYQLSRKGKAVAAPLPERVRVIRIIERARTTLTGTLKRSAHYFYVIPDDPRINTDVLVPDPRKSGLTPAPQVDDKVVVKLKEWKQRHLNPEGEIIDVLGKTHSPEAEEKGTLHRYNLHPEFPPAVMREVERLPQAVRERDLHNRLDYRKKFVFTIDPDDAKDFDDALSFEELENGEVRVGVHIADVGAYVRPGSALDREARNRGNSTYLVGRVIPMLPPSLSNGICSLVEGEDRLTKSVFMIFTPQGRIKRTDFANTVIRSRKRLTYHQALAFLREDDFKKIRGLPPPPAHQTGSGGRALSGLSDSELGALRKKIRLLWKFANRLRVRRMNKGSLDLETSEIKVYVDKKGFAERIERVQSDESHQLIEEFMLAANEAVAKNLRHARFPIIYRVHDKPDPEKLAELREYLVLFNLQVGDLTLRKEVSRLLRMIKEHPQCNTLRIAFLRSLKMACYRAECDGHYGLNKTNYTHFTSPIRRFSDLVVHRVFDAFLVKNGNDTAPSRLPKKYLLSDLNELARHLSQTEKNSTEAERESVKIKLLEYFEREARKRKKSTFEAFITDVKNHGLFVELKESMAYGLVPTSSLPDDLYALSQDGITLKGRRKNNKFSLGQTIWVAVKKVDRYNRQIDFSLADPGRRESPPPVRNRRARERRAARG